MHDDLTDSQARWIGRTARGALILLVMWGATSRAGLLSARREPAPVLPRASGLPRASDPRPLRARDFRRATDEAGLLRQWTLGKFEEYLEATEREVGADIRIQLKRDVPGDDLERYAREQMRLLGVGRDVGQRGVLFVYDVSRRRLRIEVGPGLEGVLPDGFVGHLMRDGAATFFAEDNPDLAMRTTLYIMKLRLREAALGDDFNRGALALITDSVRLAAGAGATAPAGVGVPAPPIV